MNGYGEITKPDADLLESVLATFKKAGKLKFLEIGTWHGNTSLGVALYCKKNGIDLECWGIDVAPPPTPYVGKFIIGKSEDVWKSIPDGFDVIFQDACHCLSHVAIDALIYSQKIKLGGFMLFHDTAPQIQHFQTNHWVHSPESRPEHLTAVNDALEMIGWPNSQWHFWGNAFDANSNIGGMKAFKRL